MYYKLLGDDSSISNEKVKYKLTDDELERIEEKIMEVIEWLEEHDMAQYITKVTAEKPRGVQYIDDKGYRFNNWEETLKFIANE